jgi:hypothetical protein
MAGITIDRTAMFIDPIIPDMVTVVPTARVAFFIRRPQPSAFPSGIGSLPTLEGKGDHAQNMAHEPSLNGS